MYIEYGGILNVEVYWTWWSSNLLFVIALAFTVAVIGAVL